MAIINILSIDPGITNMGWAISEYNTTNQQLFVKHYGHLKCSTLAKKEKSDCNLFGQQVISFKILRDHINTLLSQYPVDYVVSEDAFLKHPRLIKAYASLRLCIGTIAQCCYQYKLALHTLAPKYIKLKVANNGKADKDAMKVAVFKHPNISIKILADTTYDDLVEHEIDAIGVGWALMVSFQEQNLTT